MSIILKGIDLPKDIEHIIALIKSNGKCSYQKQDIEYGICEPMQTVEAIQIPTPHGRIADVGEGEKKMCGECQFKDDCLEGPNVLCTDREIFSLAPTILEAER